MSFLKLVIIIKQMSYFNFFFIARSNCTLVCPNDCVVTKYDITQSGTPRSDYDSFLHITSLSKKNEQLAKLAKDIKRLDDLCIKPEHKEQMVKELKQLRQNIAYSSSHLHFFWQHETMVSHVRDQVYDLWDMISNDITYFFYSILKNHLYDSI